MVIAEISVVPLGTGSTGLSEYVAACQVVLQDDPRINFQLTPMGTIVEGDLAVVLEVAQKLHEVPFQKGAKRVVLTIKIDDRRDKEASMSKKLQSVKEKLQKT